MKNSQEKPATTAKTASRTPNHDWTGAGRFVGAFGACIVERYRSLRRVESALCLGVGLGHIQARTNRDATTNGLFGP